MNIQNFYKNRNQIVSGHLNELKEAFSLTSDEKKIIYSYRENICNQCPVKTQNVCDSKKWINPKTKELKYFHKEGFIKGCGCRLSAKQKAYNARCPAGFWGGEETMIRNSISNV
ncbi:hypothetical protein [Aquimarina longa]|uniref:hypothetical protein n=1 Tax=Aquimarina longa TaxID=1080221 RepID=UPI000783B3E7|nr:hypothetical protein [Aquimarina longa]